ncbi:hypothetical protein SLEP1_g42078 [Rubroshorea leprosula]|uniref:DUF7870 domain-containing protein n=1 Tax=Rubroshorea leprosula TaxID=152421 RepID=A0AAV5L8N2_9ROSI|nr:hypothetical protein SLEP1_g42078 [Rubroshorea leprosula]
MAIQIVDGFRFIKRHRQQKLFPYAPVGFRLDTYLLIRLPDSRVLRLLSRCLLLSLMIVSFPWLRSVNLAATTALDAVGSNPLNLELLPLLFRDLNNEGLLKIGDKALFVSNGGEDAISTSQILKNNEMELVSAMDFEGQSSIPNESFDFTFTHNFHAGAEFIDRTLKVGGMAVTKLGEDPSFVFNKPSNYKIVYLRQFDSPILAMKKVDYAEGVTSPTQRRLFTYSPDKKKDALKKLEDVLLEPPRAASGRSSRYLKKTRYLPDLLGDSLENYPRRVFIDVGSPEKDGGSGTSWFAKNYPTRNLKFDIYKIETVTEESMGKEVQQAAEIGMSDWMRKNLKEEEFVVMKTEAEMVDEMVKSKAIALVDELFLDCKPGRLGVGGRKYMGKRAYWECLALYGRLKDEGVAVHQWWG